MNNNNLSFSLDDIPDKIESKIKPGLHKLTITRCELITCKTGSKAVQFDYKLDNTDFAIKLIIVFMLHQQENKLLLD